MSSVDIIIPCYRYGHFLRTCAESALTQIGPDIRVLIIDDASPDNTPEVASSLAREDSRVVYMRHASNKGHISTFNEGIEKASADYLLLLSADDYLLPGALSRSVEMMDGNPAIGFAFGKAMTLDAEGVIRESPRFAGQGTTRVLSGMEYLKLSKSRNLVLTPTAIVRTKLQKRLGGYRSELPHSGDAEMWWRIAAHASVGFLDNFQAVYRRHATNMSLSYAASLSDLRQRKLALDCFFQSCHTVLPNCVQLNHQFYWSLACDAVGFASEAFNRRDLKSVSELLAFACEVCPTINRSLPWTRLAVKRSFGPGFWNRIGPVLSGVRHLR